MKKKLKKLSRAKKALPKARKPAARKVPAQAAPVTKQEPLSVRVNAMIIARAKARKAAHRSFAAAEPLPGVIPPKGSSMALDAAPTKKATQWAFDSVMNAPGWGASTLYNAMWAEGMSFMGYPVLSELAQIPEYRRITEITATEMTRMWIEIKSKSDDGSEDGGGDKDADPDKDADADKIGRAPLDADPDPDQEDEDEGAAERASDEFPPDLKAKPKAAAGDPAADPSEEDGEEGDEDDEEADAQADAAKARRKALQDKISKINDRMEELRVRDAFRKIAETDGFFGRAHLYLDLGNSDDTVELKMPIGDGTSELSKLKVGKERPLLAIRPIEPVWTYPANYNANDPLKGTWYHPETWFVMGKEVHSTRLLTFVGREVPDMLKPAFAFGGLSLSQMAMPYVNNWLRTRQSVSDLIHSFSVSGIKTNLQASLQADGNQLFERLDMFNTMKDNQGVMLLQNGAEADREEFFNVSVPLGTLDALQSQAQEHMAAVSGIPIVKLLGIQPSGLNASSEGEIRTWYDWVAAQQERVFKVNLQRVINFIQLSLFGEIDPDIIFEFKPLWTLDEKGQAEVRKLEAETGGALIDSGVISPEEERKRVVSDPNTPYSGLDPDDVPEPPDMGAEAGGLFGGGPGGEEGDKPADGQGPQAGKPPQMNKPPAPGKQ